MKSLSIALIALTLSASAMATEIVAVDYTNNDKTSYELSSGLHEDGFTRSDYICFKGDISGVCSLIQNEAASSSKNYGRGGHGYFDAKACTVEGKSVALTYERHTDYGDEDQTLKIEECKKL